MNGYFKRSGSSPGNIGCHIGPHGATPRKMQTSHAIPAQDQEARSKTSLPKSEPLHMQVGKKEDGRKENAGRKETTFRTKGKK